MEGAYEIPGSATLASFSVLRILIAVDANLMNVQEPFSPPPLFNEDTIDQLKEIVTEKVAESQDNLWLLQTDPAYFYDITLYWNQHNTSRISGARPEKAAVHQFLWGRVLFYAISQVREWYFIEEQLHQVQQQFKLNKAAIKPGQKLPEQYDRAVGALVLVLFNIMQHKSTHIHELRFTSPAWISKWEAVAGPRCSVNKMKIDSPIRPKNGTRYNSRECYKSDHVLFCLAALGQPIESILYV